MKAIFEDDAQFWFETLRVLGHSSYGGSEVGEVLATAGRIAAGDYDGWYDEWSASADRVAREARMAAAAGHDVTARDGLLRASNYYRNADFFLHGNPDDPRIRAAHTNSVVAFQEAAARMPYPLIPVEIPFEGTTLHGYYYRAPGEGRTPVVVMHNGFDGSVEEMHFFGAAAAVERGYDVLSFDGPGQPSARLNDGLVFRPDWENVVTPVIDWLLEARAADVDPAKIALLGISMGGVLAPRAAAFEHRLAALMVVDGVYDLGDVSTRPLPIPRPEADALLRAADAPELDTALEESMQSEPTARWAFTHGMYAMGVDTPRKFLASYLDYSVASGLAEQITAPVLVADAEHDLFFQGQAEKLYEHITAPKKLLRFTTAEGAGAHCQTGAQRLAFGRIYDWLDDTLALRS